MNRLNRYLSGALAALLAAAAPALCADLLVDDFTDATASRQKWRNTLSQEEMTANVGGGTVTITNTSAFGAEYLYDKFDPKPTVFTASVVLKSSTNGEAGLYFCRKDDNYNGYMLSIDNGYLLVMKFLNGTGSSVHYKPGLGLNASDNKLTVSKSGSVFNLFLNDIFQGSFKNTEFPSGDVSLFVPKQSSAVFGTFRMTNEFTEAPTSFTDDFSGANLKNEWRFLEDAAKPTLGNGILTAAVASGGSTMYTYISMDLADFNAGVDVRHVSGSTSPLYGLVLIGEGTPNAPVPMVYFWIRGDQYYSVYNNMTDDLNESIKQSNAILGSAGASDVIWIDKLKIRKAPDASTYEFTINDQPVSSAHPVANFKIIGVGLVCQGGQTIAFDNFYVEKEGATTSINRGSNQISRRAPSPATTRDRAFYDMRGRKRYTLTPAATRAQTRAAGVYVNKNGRDVAVKRGRVAGE